MAVMFASIPNYLDFQMKCDAQDEGIHSLELLNKIIAAFDAVCQVNAQHDCTALLKCYLI